MTRPRRLTLVPPCPAPVDLPPEVDARRTRQRPPLKPRRPSSAVRKSLRAALASSEAMLGLVVQAEARFPWRAKVAVDALARHGQRIANLSDELRHALACEHRYHLWRNGRRYDE